MPRLLLSQRNEVLEAIQAAGFDPSEFEWESRRGPWSSEATDVLVHQPSRGVFVFDISPRGLFMATYVPGDQTTSTERQGNAWAQQLGTVKLWLQNLKREIYAPNLWDEIARQRKLLAAAQATENDDNSPFDPDERVQISKHLREIQQMLVKSERLSRDHQQVLKARIGYLEEASTRMGRRDWLTLFYGTVFSWALTALISPDAARSVLMETARAIGNLFGSDLPQLPGGGGAW